MAEDETNKTHSNLISSIDNIQCILRLTRLTSDHSYKKKDIPSRYSMTDRSHLQHIHTDTYYLKMIQHNWHLTCNRFRVTSYSFSNTFILTNSKFLSIRSAKSAVYFIQCLRFFAHFQWIFRCFLWISSIFSYNFAFHKSGTLLEPTRTSVCRGEQLPSPWLRPCIIQSISLCDTSSRTDIGWTDI